MKKLIQFMLTFLLTTYSYASNEEKDIFDKYDAPLTKLLQTPQLKKEDITSLYVQLKNDTTFLAKAYRGCIRMFNCVRPKYNKINVYTKIEYAYNFLCTQDYKSGLITNCMGYCLQSGYGVEKDNQKAIELYTKAVELGNAAAMNNLAYIYKHGIGIDKDIRKAIELNTKAVELGNAATMNNLAYIYKHGIGIDKDIPKAIELYTKAVELGNTAAMNNLAFCYKHGIGVEKNIPKAIKLHTKAVESGEPVVMKNLTSIYENIESVKNLKYVQILYILQKENSTLDLLSENEIYATKFIFTLFNKGDFLKEILKQSQQDIKIDPMDFDEQVLRKKWIKFGIQCFELIENQNCPDINIWLEIPDVATQTYFVPVSEKFYNSLECLQWEKHQQNTLTIPLNAIGLRLYKIEDSFYAAIGQEAMKYADEIMQSIDYQPTDKDQTEKFNILRKEYLELLKEYNREKIQLFLSAKNNGLNQNLKRFLFI